MINYKAKLVDFDKIFWYNIIICHVVSLEQEWVQQHVSFETNHIRGMTFLEITKYFRLLSFPYYYAVYCFFQK